MQDGHKLPIFNEMNQSSKRFDQQDMVYIEYEIQALNFTPSSVNSQQSLEEGVKLVENPAERSLQRANFSTNGVELSALEDEKYDSAFN